MINKERIRLLVGCDEQMTMGLEDNLGDHTPSSHKSEKITSDDISGKSFPGINSSDDNIFNLDDGIELGAQPIFE